MNLVRPARPRGGQRLGPGDRLRTGWEYRRVYEGGRSIHGRRFVLFFLVDNELPRRAGFVASRKVGDSVHRNRARRRLREAYRQLKSRLPESGAWIVFVARKPCAEESQKLVNEEMLALLIRAGLTTPLPPAL
ncbi:MAG: ribonuclease P protein component [Candidatus Eisenbacteria bacterium]|nr:ribonuclease P protein component [Candidatus Eisenbacteria bacterium]